MKPVTITQEQAEIIAFQGLAFLAKDPDLMGRFIAICGISPQELKNRFKEPDFLGGVLDFILADDKTLLAFCEETTLSPETLIYVRQVLPGGVVEQ